MRMFFEFLTIVICCLLVSFGLMWAIGIDLTTPNMARVSVGCTMGMVSLLIGAIYVMAKKF
jgi:hypothetical protein